MYLELTSPFHWEVGRQRRELSLRCSGPGHTGLCGNYPPPLTIVTQRSRDAASNKVEDKEWYPRLSSDLHTHNMLHTHTLNTQHTHIKNISGKCTCTKYVQMVLCTQHYCIVYAIQYQSPRDDSKSTWGWVWNTQTYYTISYERLQYPQSLVLWGLTPRMTLSFIMKKGHMTSGRRRETQESGNCS